MSGFIALHREALDHPLFQGDAQRLGVNDRLFAAPEVDFIKPCTGRFVIEIGTLEA